MQGPIAVLLCRWMWTTAPSRAWYASRQSVWMFSKTCDLMTKSEKRRRKQVIGEADAALVAAACLWSLRTGVGDYNAMGVLERW